MYTPFMILPELAVNKPANDNTIDDSISHEELEYDFEIDEIIWPQHDWDNEEQQHYFQCLHRYHDRDFPF